jgi:hypothetical protein
MWPKFINGREIAKIHASESGFTYCVMHRSIIWTTHKTFTHQNHGSTLFLILGKLRSTSNTRVGGHSNNFKTTKAAQKLFQRTECDIPNYITTES